MGRFAELLGLARAPEFTIHADYVDALQAAHDEELTGAAGETTVLTEEILKLNEEISSLKGRMYDMMIQAPRDKETVENDENPAPGDNGGEDSIDIDDLFE